MGKMAYYTVNSFDGEELLLVAEKGYYDKNGYLDENEIAKTPLGQALEAIGLTEEAESTFSIMDWSGRNLTEQEIVSRMKEKGWTLIPFPEQL